MLRNHLSTVCGMDYMHQRNRAVIIQNIQVNTGRLLIATHQNVVALELAQDYSKCYPYMNTTQLIRILHAAWENAAALCLVDQKQIKRKYGQFKADTRTDKNLLLSMENLLNEVRGMSILHLR